MLYNQIQESVAFIRKQTDFQPHYGIILGTGLGNLTNDIETVASIPYKDIPHFPISTVQSHKGQLVFGYLAGKPICGDGGAFSLLRRLLHAAGDVSGAGVEVFGNQAFIHFQCGG